jgi:isoleucyl-tRNA synthetase
MIENRPDWCISRQRAWGVPIPGFHNRETGEAVMDATLVRHVRDLFAQHGSDYWFTHETADLLPPGYPDADKREKENDIFDVWFESGASHWSVCRADGQMSWPVDLYLEGSDQHRGWFQVSMITAMCARDDAPYEAVLTHGFVVDETGAKMSKSKGNFISVADATESVGADIFRLWVAATNYRDDINTSIGGMQQVGESYRRIRNTIRFMLGNLHDFVPSRHAVPAEQMLLMDRWAVMQANRLHGEVCRFYDEYLFHRVFGELFRFCDATLSGFYLDSLKDRLYCDGRDSISRRSAQTAIYHCVSQLIQLLAPICPFTAEEAFAATEHKWIDAESVHLLELAPVPGEWADNALADDFDRLFAIREDVLVALEQLRKDKTIGGSLDARVTLSAGGDTGAFLRDRLDLLPGFFNVSEVEVTDGGGNAEVAVNVEPSPSPKCNRCWRHLASVGEDAEHPTLCARCAEVVKEA